MKEVLIKETHEQVAIVQGHVSAHGSSFDPKVMLGVDREVIVGMGEVSWIRN